MRIYCWDAYQAKAFTVNQDWVLRFVLETEAKIVTSFNPRKTSYNKNTLEESNFQERVLKNVIAARIIPNVSLKELKAKSERKLKSVR